MIIESSVARVAIRILMFIAWALAMIPILEGIGVKIPDTPLVAIGIIVTSLAMALYSEVSAI